MNTDIKSKDTKIVSILSNKKFCIFLMIFIIGRKNKIHNKFLIIIKYIKIYFPRQLTFLFIDQKEKNFIL